MSDYVKIFNRLYEKAHCSGSGIGTTAMGFCSRGKKSGSTPNRKSGNL